ncbi:hypothetical protein [Lacihabitans sp. CCS-44]|uniref:hypothetical protein n=1 Tax=Lacihabitans sp. CCS-44 TaxID=2487331 RepID=UPI0020CDEBF9|nr:hypothetical protein [Lacihabitans sp. CCS-44]
MPELVIDFFEKEFHTRKKEYKICMQISQVEKKFESPDVEKIIQLFLKMMNMTMKKILLMEISLKNKNHKKDLVENINLFVDKLNDSLSRTL